VDNHVVSASASALPNVNIARIACCGKACNSGGGYCVTLSFVSLSATILDIFGDVSANISHVELRLISSSLLPHIAAFTPIGRHYLKSRQPTAFHIAIAYCNCYSPRNGSRK